jgi:hypothetical protein
VGDDVPVDSETLLLTDFINLKIKPTQSFESFRCAHSDRICVRMFIKMSPHTYISIVFQKNKKNPRNCVCLEVCF